MDSSKIISEMLRMLRHSQDTRPILKYACESLTRSMGASRCVIWTVVGDAIEATEEFSVDSAHECFRNNKLNSRESISVVLEFLSRFPDESGTGLIYVSDTARDDSMHKFSPMMASLLELGYVRSRLLGQLRAAGIFAGFVDLHMCGQTKVWSEADCQAFEEVIVAISVVVQQHNLAQRLEAGMRDLRAIKEIGDVFDDSKDSRTAWQEAACLLALRTGFDHSQIYLFEKQGDKECLVPQISNGQNQPLDLTDEANPFVQAFLSSAGKILNIEYVRDTARDPFFNGETALLQPFKNDGRQLGVFGLWQRNQNTPPFEARQRELCLTVAKLFGFYARRMDS